MLHLIPDTGETCHNGGCRYAADLGKAGLAFLREHAVQGQRLLPATAMLEAAAEACSMLRDGPDIHTQTALRATSFLRAADLAG